MIRYALCCEREHGFEGWFASSADFDIQNGRKLVACPVCGTTEIRKELMAPSVATSRKRVARSERDPATLVAIPPAELDDGKREMLRQLRQFRDKILADSENVGPRFSEEARRIHYGEAEQRGIHGQASLDEAAELLEEGIAILPILELPGDRN